MTAERDDTIGSMLRRRRHELNLKQDDVAKMLGVNQSTVAKYERGDRIGADRLDKVAEFLGLDFDDVLRIYHGFSAEGAEPASDPRDAQVEALTAQVATLSAQMAELLTELRGGTSAPAPRTGRSRRPSQR